MKKQYKITFFEPGRNAANHVNNYYTFEEAKAALRKRICAAPEAVQAIIGMIENYTHTYYPQDTPPAFRRLADILTALLTDPDYPRSLEEVVLDGFEDERFEFDLWGDELVSHYTDDEYDGMFPVAEINVFQMDDPQAEYHFFLADNVHGWPNYNWNYSLSPILEGEEDEENEYWT